MTVFLDLDEVLADFTGAALAVHGWTRERLECVRDPGRWGLAEPMGMTVDEFWRPIHDLGETFWATIELLPWAQQVLELVEDTDWYIVTSPSDCITSYVGKLRWVHENLNAVVDHRCLLTPHKHFLASYPGAILIDDRESSIERFRSAGGIGILFPSTCNSLHEMANDPIPYLKERLDALPLQKH